MAKLQKPKLRKNIAAPPSAKITDPEPEVETPQEDDGGDSGFLAFGDRSQEQVAQYREQVSTPFVREFFISGKEIAASSDDKVTARVHLLFDYTQKDWNASAPFINLMEGNRPKLMLSPGNGDCALQAGGLNPSVRPIYFLMDHRTFKTKDGKTGTDGIKIWIPASNVAGLLGTAVADLRENLGVEEEDDLDITEYELKITKTGVGRKSSWALAFTARHKPLDQDQKDAVIKYFGFAGFPRLQEYRQYLGKIIRPNPQYLLSKNGNRPYQAAPRMSEGDVDHNTPY